MHRFKGRTALVTGASSGIGFTLCKTLVEEYQVKVIGVARNITPLKELVAELKSGCLIPISCDLTKEEEVENLFKTIAEHHGGVDICINNAGMSIKKTLMEGTRNEWRTMLDVNVLGLCHCSQLAIESMQKRKVDDGHVINVSSLAAHLLSTSKYVHFYTATKHAVRAITEGFRLEMREMNSHIKISCVSPGLVRTDFFRRATGSEKESEEVLSQCDPLTAKDITDSIIYILSAPPHVEINDMIIRPVEQAV